MFSLQFLEKSDLIYYQPFLEQTPCFVKTPISLTHSMPREKSL